MYGDTAIAPAGEGSCYGELRMRERRPSGLCIIGDFRALAGAGKRRCKAGQSGKLPTGLVQGFHDRNRGREISARRAKKFLFRRRVLSAAPVNRGERTRAQLRTLSPARNRQVVEVDGIRARTKP